MTDDRFRVPVDDAYVEALGRFTYIFATYEWNAAWCCERMKPGYLRKLGKKTAGIIAQDLVKLAERRPITDRADVLAPAEDFERLVKVRNRILHGKPGTAKNGDQRLFDHGTEWTVDAINAVSDEMTVRSGDLNKLLYGLLK